MAGLLPATAQLTAHLYPPAGGVFTRAHHHAISDAVVAALRGTYDQVDFTGRRQVGEADDAAAPMLLDLFQPDMTRRFAAAPIHEKTAEVHIRAAEPGEQVDTILPDGTLETCNVAAADQYVVTNRARERYLISADAYAMNYVDLDDGRHQAKGLIRAFVNPVGRDIVIRAPWVAMNTVVSTPCLLWNMTPETRRAWANSVGSLTVCNSLRRIGRGLAASG